MLGGGKRPFDVHCLLDSQPGFQIEMFEFPVQEESDSQATVAPSQSLEAHGPGRAQGYGPVKIAVHHFAPVIERLQESGCLRGEFQEALELRKARAVDPDGTLLEVVEDSSAALEPGTHRAPVRVSRVGLEVPDLQQGLEFYTTVAGLKEMEKISGLPSRRRLGGSLGWLDLELSSGPAQQSSPTARPIDRPIDRQVGVLHLALTAATRPQFDDLKRRILETGCPVIFPPISVPSAVEVTFVRDPFGNPLELLFVEESARERMGFLPT